MKSELILFFGDVAKFFNLNNQVFVMACIVAGMMFALNRAFIGKNWLQSTLGTSLFEPLFNLIRNKGGGEIIKYFEQLVGSAVILLASFLIIYLFLAIFYSLSKRKQSSFGDVFADFWKGGHQAIDWRNRELSRDKEYLANELDHTHRIYSRINHLSSFYLSGHLDEGKWRNITILIIETLSSVFNKHFNFRFGVFLFEDDPLKKDKLILACSAHPAKQTPDYVNIEWSINNSVAGEVYKRGSVITHPTAKSKGKFKPGLDSKNSFAKSFTCIRIESKKKKWGVLTVDSADKEFPKITEGQLVLLRFVGTLIARGLEESNGCIKWKSVELV